MSSFLVRRAAPLLLLAVAACTAGRPGRPTAMSRPSAPDLLAQMRMVVPRAANRPVSFTNKAAAYYFTQTHRTDHPEWSWFEGLNVAKNRVFGGYELWVNGQPLDNAAATEVAVYPHLLQRRHAGGAVETLWLLDERNVLAVDLDQTHNAPLALHLKGEKVNFLRQQADVAFFSAREGNFLIAVAPRQAGQALTVQNQRAQTTGGTGFLVAVGKDEAEATALIREAQQRGEELKQARRTRMGEYLRGPVYLHSPHDSLTQALRWLHATTDQLITHQQGEGIYAGLPWFNEYWGRDEFISLPGMALVTGQFGPARRILLSFAQYQQLDPTSRYYGRVPNIVNPSNIDYHTTDGTPRFVLGLQDYVRYSGDTSLVRQLYPNVRASIEGALKYWTDDKGYLLHEDNETWMDARDQNLVAYTPRGTRANDIQALWVEQLRAGAAFAALLHDAGRQQQWQQLADRVQAHFARDFAPDARHPYLADRLDAQNRPDFTLRPNQLYALDLVPDAALRRQVVRQCWQELVYPWGVASLNRQAPAFHPYHLAPGVYHKDAAYHRGAVWLWNNGIAMQRMLEAGQSATAWQLFANMNRQTLTRGVVGGLSENMDAYPHPGEAWPRLTGTYLQAWSNAEQLRVWYQYFLGIRPDLGTGRLTLAPRLPQACPALRYTVRLGAGQLDAQYQPGPTAAHSYILHGFSTTAVVDVAPFPTQEVQLPDGATLHLHQSSRELRVQVLDAQGRPLATHTLRPNAARQAQQQQDDAALAGVPFAQPFDLSRHPIMQVGKKE
ncbi:amylo-alpha-1,6-glucosidase [Hymenobacter yonginensis]|uniref:Glycogen debranching enzyme C-terminal domain-containing protein n=1 Tax=Hymenobacter yonginensis TaxID=748197 RepID=A0ABY7PSN0_9BACT|nr:amylo-alpha-1,6-glucosidase [Hymenobacter yonginensis]WBO85915.1 hypothetical protein O9Z63_06600 [Hymenobacter yonginensis]